MYVDVEKWVVGPLETNCYLITDTGTLEAALIDPGGPNTDHGFDLQPGAGDAFYIGRKLKYVLLTHGHPDHCFCAGAVARNYGAEIAMHESDLIQIEQGRELADMFYDMSRFVAFSPTKLLNDGDVLELGGAQIKVIHTPGHSQGGVCFVTDAGVFCGDTIFAGSIGRTDFPGGDHEQLISSIHTSILTMLDGTRLYPGHGPSTTVGRERARNPFLA